MFLILLSIKNVLIISIFKYDTKDIFVRIINLKYLNIFHVDLLNTTDKTIN